ncbi:isoamylase early set domain-containing protein [Bowmanella dokdonensis]|uniref:Isoamylase early set domain-containing protein n=1 Tax=Bowmanella dokdonensis TaxID=751969 RepID=A0A939DRD4_9ALTE|nr:isoamylase early set domain-containing protein [Bowmanella dokdonensis]MBN7827599.1 isoamylase early set domain-containing protein [Bowmanella dokdonensis]
MSFKKQYLKSKNICKVTFKLSSEEAKHANTVRLVGDFNQWNKQAPPMKRLKNGSFTATLDLPKGQQYQFRYLLDDSAWENDWHADQYVPSPLSMDDNSVIAL